VVQIWLKLDSKVIKIRIRIAIAVFISFIYDIGTRKMLNWGSFCQVALLKVLIVVD
jgi:hypothetical protein